jgi:uroporphyrinogen-III synthase
VRELEGLGVLVTRPEAQAGPLAHALEAAGARVYRLPTLEIRMRPDRAAVRAAVGPVDRYHWVIFVSANAVRHGVALLEGRADAPIAAIGPATATALRLAGHRVRLSGEGSFDSEHLLAAPELANVAGQRILVVRGVGGRDLVLEQLRARGAEVVCAEVYERACAVPVPGAVDAVESAWSAGQIAVATATSVEVLRCLVELLTPRGRALLRESALLAGGARVAATAREMGLAGPLIVATSPESGVLVDALRRWRRHTKSS